MNKSKHVDAQQQRPIMDRALSSYLTAYHMASLERNGSQDLDLALTDKGLVVITGCAHNSPRSPPTLHLPLQWRT